MPFLSSSSSGLRSAWSTPFKASFRYDATLRALWIARFEGGVVAFILGAIAVATAWVWRPTPGVASSAAEDDAEK